MSESIDPPPAALRQRWGERIRRIMASGAANHPRPVRLGAGDKVALLVVLVVSAGAAAAMALEVPRWIWPGGIVGWVGLLWSFAVGAAARLPVWGFAAAGLWLGWQAVALMGSWAGTPLVALPAGWLWLVALSCWAWHTPGNHRQAGLAGWLGVSLGMGWLLGGPTGWNDLLGLGSRQGWAGQLLLAAGLAAAGIALRPRWKAWAWTRPDWGKTVSGSLAVMGLGLWWSLRRDAAATEGWAWGEVELAGGWPALMWFLLGGAAGVVLVGGAEWLTRQAVAGRTGGMTRQGWPILWLAVTLLEWFATHEGSNRLMAGLVRKSVSGWPVQAREAVAAHAWVGVAVVVLGAGFLYQGRDTARLLLRLNAVWLASLAALLMSGTVLAAETGGTPASGGHPGAAVLLGLGMTWLVRKLWQEVPWGSSKGPAAAWGLLAALTGLIAADAIQELQAGTWRTGPAAVLGLVHLGLPVVLHRWWVRGRHSNRVSLTLPLQGGLILAGIAGVLPALQAESRSVALLGWEPVWWSGVLWVLKRQRPLLETADGALAGGLLGVAAVAAWCRPDLLLPMVPVLPWFNVPDAVLAGDGRPFLEPMHFVLLLILGSTGAVLGALIFRSRGAPGLDMMPLIVDETGPSPQGPGGMQGAAP